MLLYQMHMQSRDQETEFVSQREFDGDLSLEEIGGEIHKWRMDVMQRHELPHEWNWLTCDATSKHFMLAAD
jgi:hypothetical protein